MNGFWNPPYIFWGLLNSFSKWFKDKYNTDSKVIELINRTGNQSDTYTLAKNYKQQGIYIIHGDKDDNVRPEQAYSMIDTLKTFHNDFVFHEQKDVD